jgi:predicted XRE-type DNA-binding protein
MSKDIFKGSGNVFADLGLPNSDERQLKAQLAAQIQISMQQKGLTQAQLAALVELTQPKVSQLLNGQLSGFSAEKLMHILNRLGRNIEVRVALASETSEHTPAQTLVTVA